MEKYAVGILAHVDSGKTTLAESMLYMSGAIKKQGRVDHKDTFLDNHELERARGITIFSKQARFRLGDSDITLLDTPGHIDFSAEMERTLQVLDYAVLVINGADGVQAHTKTLWKLLKRYMLPVFIFVNKMDQPGTDKKWLLEDIQKNLDFRCVDFGLYYENGDAFFDALAMCDEDILNSYVDKGVLSDMELRDYIAKRRVFPCIFGSALKREGVDSLLDIFSRYKKMRTYSDEFGARVYKIERDDKNTRITHMKITGGSMKVKDVIHYSARGRNDNSDDNADDVMVEKINQIRLYSGSHFETVNEVRAGEICAVTGLSETCAGQGIGDETEPETALLTPVLTYKINVLTECNIYDFYLKMKLLEEEEPQLNVIWNEKAGEIHAQVMGEVQIEILKSIIRERFGIEVDFGVGQIVYRETIESAAVGIGHFEPLRHYAEVHLYLEPLERGSGLRFESKCSEDILDRNWQRLILTHLEEKQHIGVLTGSEITDMKISIIAGRAHQKHTEGGDFRQAVYRAVRQGLKTAKSILLEPYYEFRLEIPGEQVGRAMTDIQKRFGHCEPLSIENDTAILTGTAPVDTMRDYHLEVVSYSRGKGKLFCTLKGYERCHNEAEVIEAIGYDSENDTENPTGSVFCSHGAGYYVSWDKVAEYAHAENGFSEKNENVDAHTALKTANASYQDGVIGEDEIEEIFLRTFGGMGKKRTGWTKKVIKADEGSYRQSDYAKKPAFDKEYLLVDGYNIIFAWEELKALADVNIDSARDRLLDIMCNYQGYRKIEVIVVFDAYKVHGGKGSFSDYHNIHVVYTKEAETADRYIEGFTHVMGKKHKITVATSDRLEQMIIWGEGASRLSASGLKEEIDRVSAQIADDICDNKPKSIGNSIKNSLENNIRTAMKNDGAGDI